MHTKQTTTRPELLRARRAVSRAIRLCMPILHDVDHIIVMRAVYAALSRILKKLPGHTKPKGCGIKTLTKKLDDIFSIFIRMAFSDSDGVAECYTCRTRHKWQNLENGHFIGRQYTMLRWNRKNVRPQCHVCNGFNEGNKAEYRRRLVEDVGEQEVLWLEANKKKRRHSRTELEMMIAHYNNVVTGLRAERGTKVS